MAGFLSAMLAGVGTFLLYTALVFGWRGLRLGPPAERASVRHQLSQALVRHGLPDVRVEELVAACGVMALVGAGMAFAIFGGIAAPIVAGLSAAAVPAAAQRARIRSQRDIARDVWPRMIEEVRLAATSLGRSIPQALFDVGLRSPIPLRPAFEAAHREWLLSTDFERALAVLKARCADATADAVCETLLVAHEVGGADVDRRLIALAEDRSADLQGRKDAASKQAGARFARWFVLVVPLGMALIGLSIGDGRSAYASAAGQLSVALGVGLVVLCWWWAGRIMRLPAEQRVFDRSTGVPP